MLSSLTRRAANTGDMLAPLSLTQGLIVTFVIICTTASLLVCVRRSKTNPSQTVSSTQVPMHASWYACVLKKKVPTDIETGSFELQQIPHAAIMQRKRVLRKLQKADPNLPQRHEDAKPSFTSVFGRGGSTGRAAGFKDIGKDVPTPAWESLKKPKKSPVPGVQDAPSTPGSAYSGLSGTTLAHTHSARFNATTKPSVHSPAAAATQPTTPPHGEQINFSRPLPSPPTSDTRVKSTRAMNTVSSPRPRVSFDEEPPTVSVAFGSAPSAKFKRPPRMQKVALTGEYGMSRCRTPTRKKSQR